MTVLVGDIWLSLLDEEAGPAMPRPDGERVASARVGIEGGSHAEVVVDVSWPAAERLAHAMFGDDIDDEAVTDAVGEVANQFAGGVKGLLEGECHLTVPVTSDQDDLALTGHEPTCQSAWPVAGGHVGARVWLLGAGEVRQ